MSADAPSPAALRLSQRNRLVALEAEIARARRDARRGTCALLFRKGRNASLPARQLAPPRTANAGRAARLIAAQEAAPAPPAPPPSALRSWRPSKRKSAVWRRRATRARSAATCRRRARGTGRRIGADAIGRRRARCGSRSARRTPRSPRRAGRLAARRRNPCAAAVRDRAEHGRWLSRRDAAASADRRTAAAAIRGLADRTRHAEGIPDLLATKRNALLDAIAQAETARAGAADARAEAETVLAEADKARQGRRCSALDRARRTRPRPGAGGSRSRTDRGTAQPASATNSTCAPDDLRERAEIEDGEELPPLEQAEKRVETPEAGTRAAGRRQSARRRRSGRTGSAPDHAGGRPRRSRPAPSSGCAAASRASTTKAASGCWNPSRR